MAASLKIPLLDLKAQHAAIRDEVLAEIVRVIDSQNFILGPDVTAFEAEFAAYCGTRFAVGCASGSDALLLSLLALGIGPGDEVLTSPFTFLATAGAIRLAGARPVFADIDPFSFCIDAGQAIRIMKEHPGLRAVIPVHLFGACAEMDDLVRSARQLGIAVVEDAAQAVGAGYKGVRAGSIGDSGCFSFFPSKNLGGYGDGGVVTTNNAALAEKAAMLRVHGSKTRYYYETAGLNSRLDTLQAAVLRVKLRHLDSWTAKRQAHAALYNELLRGVEPVKTPPVSPTTTRHIYNQYVIRAERRDQLKEHLGRLGIGSEIYYPLPLHLQPCFADLSLNPGEFPVSERAAREVLALPVFPEMTDDDIRQVSSAVAGFYGIGA